MEFFRDTSFDFMKYRRIWLTVSAVLLLVGIFAVFVQDHLNLGIDFAGGTQLTVKFDHRPEVDELRSVLAAAGVEEAQIQRFGEEGEHEVIIKTPTAEESEEGQGAEVVAALDAHYNPDSAGHPDLNRLGSEGVADLLYSLDPREIAGADEETARAHYATVAETLAQRRQESGLLESWESLEGLPEVDESVLAALRENAHLGSFAVLGRENVGPQIGAELRRKGVLAVLFSLVGMLAYIWLRFELRFGVGALVAGTHDVLITLGLFALAGYEFNLTTIAGFLTLVGYSVNDSVVVFDRVRENMRQSRRLPLAEVMNRSLNQTLSRTVLTSGTTLLAVGSLFFLGGDVTRGFAFIMTVGVVVGTYSSIYIACPTALIWETAFGREGRSRRGAGKGASRSARGGSSAVAGGN